MHRSRRIRAQDYSIANILNQKFDAGMPLMRLQHGCGERYPAVI